MSDLPAGMHAKFNKVLMPRAKAVARDKRRPWLSLSVPDIQELMDEVWPDYSYQVQENDVFYDLVSTERLL